MNRHQKETVVSDLKEMFNKSKASFLVQYKGLGVSQLQDLRKRLRNDRAYMKITKARLMKIATQDIHAMESFKGNFKDQVGLVFALDEVSVVAKKLVDFSKEHEALSIVAGFFESQVISKDRVTWLASIPSREILLAQVVGTLQAPLARLAYIVSVLIERKEKEASETGAEKSGE